MLKMSKDEEVYKEFQSFIETSVHENFNDLDFIKEFREKINNYLKDMI